MLLLEKKREEILARLDGLRKYDQKPKCSFDGVDDGSDNVSVNIATSVLREDVAVNVAANYNGVNSPVEASYGKIITTQNNSQFYDPRSSQFCSNANLVVASSKDILVPTSSVPILEKSSSKSNY